MITITINDEDYNFKQNAKDLTVKEYLQIMAISSEKQEIIAKKDLDKYTEEELNKRDDDFRRDKEFRILSILSGIDKEMFVEYPELSSLLYPYFEGFEVSDKVWTKCSDYKIIKKRSGETLKEETDYEWIYEHPLQWTFQQWVDTENGIKVWSPEHVFYIAVYKRKKGSAKKRTYQRQLPDLDDAVAYWENQNAYDNMATIREIQSIMQQIRDNFHYIYKVKSKYPNKSYSENHKIFSNYAGWNEVVLGLAENNYFNSSKGTLHAVRTANCIDVLELLNWKQGKAFAEYEDYKEDEKRKEMMSR